MTFEQLQIIPEIQSALKKEGYTNPTPIQQQAIPLVMEKRDLFGIAQTGTGKTAAFAIPILQRLTSEFKNQSGKHEIRALILSPTRELAIQIGESFGVYGKNLKLKHTVIFGGVNQQSQVTAIRHGVDILIATPGRLIDLINQKIISIKHIQIFVLDEADRMLDMGFIHDIKKVISHLPVIRQTLFFSATMPPDILKLSNTILTNPATVEINSTSSTVEKVTQAVYFIGKNDKRKLLAELLKDKEIKSALVFTRTKHGADRVVKDLAKTGIIAQAIHGNKSQNQRQHALTNFKTGKTRVMVATDIAARGIDVDDLSHVFNFELPNIPETYVHRIGRTGRAGASGIALSFCDQEEKEYLHDIQKLIQKEIPVITNHPYPLNEMEHVKPSSGKNKKPLATTKKTAPNPNTRRFGRRRN